jgi:hypothetical protein
MSSRPVSVRLPDDVREAIGAVESLSAWLVDAARIRLSISKPLWRPLLGDALAARVAAVAAADPGAFCRAAIERAVTEAERQRGTQVAAARARASCPHPDGDRRGARCGRCGTRGLPAVGKVPVAKATAGGRR